MAEGNSSRQGTLDLNIPAVGYGVEEVEEMMNEPGEVVSPGGADQQSEESYATSDDESEVSYFGAIYAEIQETIANETAEVDQQTASSAIIDEEPEVSSAITEEEVDSLEAKSSSEETDLPQHFVGCTKHGKWPLFDSPSFIERCSICEPVLMARDDHMNLTMGFSIDDLIAEESKELVKKRREERLRKIQFLLDAAISAKPKSDPDLILKLQIEQKKLQLADFQAHVRAEIVKEQREIMAMPEGEYREFVKQCEKQRKDMNDELKASMRARREKQLRPIFEWRESLLTSQIGIRVAQAARNNEILEFHVEMMKGVAKYP